MCVCVVMWRGREACVVHFNIYMAMEVKIDAEHADMYDVIKRMM